MKNLSNCKPSEFLRQTNRIKKSVERWLTNTDIMNIRKRLPQYEKTTQGMSDEEKGRVAERNKALGIEQAKKNLSAMLDAILEEHPEETLEIIGLCCFIEPDEVDNYPVRDYLVAITELLDDEAVIGFFASLLRLARRNTGGASAA